MRRSLSATMALFVLAFPLLAIPAFARPALVCRVTARVPFTAARPPGFDSTRIFIQAGDVLEERRSGSALVRNWTVVADLPNQLRAVDPQRARALTVWRPGGAFADSGVETQLRGFCAENDLP